MQPRTPPLPPPSPPGFAFSSHAAGAAPDGAESGSERLAREKAVPTFPVKEQMVDWEERQKIMQDKIDDLDRENVWLRRLRGENDKARPSTLFPRDFRPFFTFFSYASFLAAYAAPRAPCDISTVRSVRTYWMAWPIPVFQALHAKTAEINGLRKQVALASVGCLRVGRALARR